MLFIVILVCSLTVTPDLTACNRFNAVKVIQPHGHYPTLALCAAHARAFATHLKAEGEVELSADQRMLAKCLVDINSIEL